MTDDPTAEPTPFRAGHRGNADRLRPGTRGESALHHYLSPACYHEARADDATAARDLHAFCALAGEQCIWCSAPCECPGHAGDSEVDGPAVDDQPGDVPT